MENAMRKTDLRSRSFNAGSRALLTNANYYVASESASGGFYDQDSPLQDGGPEYLNVRRASSASSSCSSNESSNNVHSNSSKRINRISPSPSVTSQHRNNVRWGKTGENLEYGRRNSQQPLSYPHVFITCATKIPETAPVVLERSVDKRSIYDFTQLDSYYPRREESIRVERDSFSSSRLNETCFSHENPNCSHKLSNTRCRDVHFKDSPNQSSLRRRNTIFQPPCIVTTQHQPYVSAQTSRRSSTGESERLIYPIITNEKNLNFLSVPGYDSSGTSPSTPTVSRSRSHSTPSSPELHRLEINLPENQKQKRRSLSPERSACLSRLDADMHSTYPRQTSTDQLHDQTRRKTVYNIQNSDNGTREENRIRKHSYGTECPSSPIYAQRSPNELRRIASSMTCVVSEGDGAFVSTPPPRRRILPPTPDQLIEHQKAHIRNRVVDTVPSAPAALPSQPNGGGSFYSSTSCGDEEDIGDRMKRIRTNSQRRSSSTASNNNCPRQQIASNDTLASSCSASSAASGQHHGILKTEHSSSQRTTTAGGFGEDDHLEVAYHLSTPHRTRRASAFAECAMIPASPPSNRCNSPRPGSGRKLPDTPASSKPVPNVGRMSVPFSIARQNTVGDLLRPQPPSPPNSARFHTPSRRVSEQIFSTPRGISKSAKGILAQISADHKSPASDQEDQDAAAAAATAWLMNTATKTPDQNSQMSHSRSNMGILNQLRQNSVSSSSSVPDLITTPTCPNNVGLGIGTDATTDSGHGSGAESALGDGITVSNSNSWPDAIGALNLTGTSPATSQSGDGHLTPSSGLGVLHFSIQYFPVRKRLRVSVIKAEKLAGQLRMDLELNTFVKVCLMPGKLQKQRGSRIVKRTRDATFNEEFFFDNITPEDVDTKSVYLRLCHHVGKQFQKDVVIGQSETPLKDIMTLLMGKQEVKMCQELKPKQLKKLGRLTISTSLESEARRLTINIFKVDDLPKFGISGPPDPCVRICVDQNGKTQTKQSRTLKSTCNAVFREAVMFLVSTNRQDLERTKIVITVHDTARTSSGDDAIGSVYLGQLACEKSELDQWKNTITHSGREFKATHQLKREPNSGHADDDMLNYE